MSISESQGSVPNGMIQVPKNTESEYGFWGVQAAMRPKSKAAATNSV